jgi:hypothetical protein
VIKLDDSGNTFGTRESPGGSDMNPGAFLLYSAGALKQILKGKI